MEPQRISETVARLRTSFNSGRTRPLSWRVSQLKALVRMINERSDDIIAALQADLGKPATEAWLAEIMVCEREAKEAITHLADWARRKRVDTPVIVQPARAEIYKDPLGVVLIISAWNYPFDLAIAPLIGAIAAGNAAVIKPSEVASNTSNLLARIIPKYLDSEAIQVIEGGVPETTEVLKERFDHVLYTGNGQVARIIMAAAAKHLTPVTLELGGKSPCYVHRSADLVTSCRRIAWGKWTNSGQTCIAPDYVLVDAAIEAEFLAQMKKTVAEFYGEDPAEPGKLCRIVNERHFERLRALLTGGQLVVGGESDAESRFIAPTIMTEVDLEAPVMQDEIFGPILPVIPVDDVDAAIGFVNARPKPLALYVFSKNDGVVEQVIQRTSSGGVTVNHTMIHFGVSSLPFGGVGESGMGAYHGRYSFDTFSHHKAVLRKPFFFDPSIMYPPMTPTKARWLRRLL